MRLAILIESTMQKAYALAVIIPYGVNHIVNNGT